MATNLALPKISSGNKGTAMKEREEEALVSWCDGIKEIKASLDFEIGVREWCYLLEPHGLAKSDFDKAEGLISKCRKDGHLPLNITIEDNARLPDGLEAIDDTTAAEEADDVLEYVDKAHKHYHPISLWENQEYYVELAVEKASLKSLFAEPCTPFHVARTNFKGSTDIHSRANILRRCTRWQAKSKKCILLYCGDFDPGGQLISDVLLKNFEAIVPALEAEGIYPNLSEPSFKIVRFGLNRDFIDANHLTWIDGLSTSNPNTPNLEDPRHPQHRMPFIQEWLRTIGPRKVEASALVQQPVAARALCRVAILRYVSEPLVREFLAEEAERQEEVKEEIRKLLRDWAE